MMTRSKIKAKKKAEEHKRVCRQRPRVEERKEAGIISTTGKRKKAERTMGAFHINILGESDCSRIGKKLTIEDIKEQLPNGARIESMCKYKNEGLISPKGDNSFGAAARLAFQEERNFVISPDDIWLLIAQGFGHYVTENAETVRDKIVDFKGKMEIIVERDDLIKGSPSNNWESIFPLFGEKVEEYIGSELYSTLQGKFSTTTPIMSSASQIVLLYSMKKYFNYILVTKCGIKGFKVEGTIEDWKLLRTKTESLKKYGLESWVNSLLQIVDKILESLSGVIDKGFWNSFYKWEGPKGSGGPNVSGWIINFFPYLYCTYRGLYPNPGAHIAWNMPKSLTDGSFPSGIVSAPFIWKYYMQIFKMNFIAGFIAIKQDLTYIRPYQGWIVTQDEQDVKRDEQDVKRDEQ